MEKLTFDQFVQKYAGDRQVTNITLNVTTNDEGYKRGLDPWVIVRYGQKRAIIELKPIPEMERSGKVTGPGYLDLDIFSFVGGIETEAESFGMTEGESRVDEHGRIHGVTTVVLIGQPW